MSPELQIVRELRDALRDQRKVTTAIEALTSVAQDQRDECIRLQAAVEANTDAVHRLETSIRALAAAIERLP